MLRKCTVCKVEKDLESCFHKAKSRSLGRSYLCKPCESARGKIKHLKNPRPWKYSRLTSEQKKQRLVIAKKYRKTAKGRAIGLFKAYELIDKKRGWSFDLTRDFIQNEIKKPCVYCGEDDFLKIGLDRRDNTVGHLKNNCRPCCEYCNVARSDHFTEEEMMIIGAAIKLVKDQRKSCSL